MKNLLNYDSFLNENKLNELTSGSTHLRKLTKKSKLNFGKFSDLTVENLMKTQIHYLRWIYFNSSNIDFMEDVLDELGITKEYQIEKPGKNSELGIKFTKEIYKKEGSHRNQFADELKDHIKNRNALKLGGDADDSPYTEFKFGKYAGGQRAEQKRIGVNHRERNELHFIKK